MTTKKPTVKQAAKASETKLGIITPKKPRVKKVIEIQAVAPVYTAKQGHCDMPPKPIIADLIVSERTRRYEPTIIISVASQLTDNKAIIEPAKPAEITKTRRQPTNYQGKTDRPVQNGIRLPKPETLCGQSWAICQELYDASGMIPNAKLVGDIGLERGIKRNTSQSEASMWRIYHFGRKSYAA